LAAVTSPAVGPWTPKTEMVGSVDVTEFSSVLSKFDYHSMSQTDIVMLSTAFALRKSISFSSLVNQVMRGATTVRETYECGPWLSHTIWLE
jgi:hypothetical protein